MFSRQDVRTAMLGLCTLLTACRGTNPSTSEPRSMVGLPITLAIAETLLGELMQIGLELQWKTISSQLNHAEQQLGEINAHDVADTAKKLRVESDSKFRDELKIKLNSLQDTMSRDYVAGSPDSHQLMAIMIDKANDLRNALEAQATRTDDPNHTNALATYSSYLLVSSLSLAILTERASQAEITPNVDSAVRHKLWEAVANLSRDCERYILKLNGSMFAHYAKTRLLSYDYETLPGKVDFGFAADLRIRLCMTDTAGSKFCSVPSQTVCKSELQAECLSKARTEAAAALAKSGEEDAVVEKARERFFAVNLERFAARVVANAKQRQQKASAPGSSGH
ncbi:MAG: hypothetical protein FJ146_07085 [Deltaproteobacteria bacterium]|nr:hypothetical protein [Deltaproteobacteria bacterium]